MTTDDKIKDKKMQYDVNREVEKISALSFGKIDKSQYVKGAEILNPEQKRPKEQPKFTYSPLEKILKKKLKQVEALKVLKVAEHQ